MGDAVMMLQYATYSVISPEGCASILWKSAEKAPEAAEILGITAPRLKTLGLIDKIIAEPQGGAHRDPALAAQNVKKALADTLRQLADMPTDKLLKARYERLMQYGKFEEQPA
jgi:acetyl-CoA carboxylase carboxyl transferase subunit alpha